MTSRVVVVDYDPDWPRQFVALRSRIVDALGALAREIEHVGSTSVPGLAAKPIIDIDVHLQSDTDLPLVIATLASLGYEHRGDLGVPSREAFRTPPGDFPHHLYVCLCNSEEFSRHLAFRDYLRTHTQDAHSYARLKHNLAEQFPADREAYNHGKRGFVEEILRRAANLPDRR